MASLKKQLRNNLPTKQGHTLQNQFKLFLKQVFRSQQLAKPTLLVAYSGGLDSTVLLHLLWHTHKEIPFHLSAMHVNHHLNEHADAWETVCEENCNQLGIPIHVASVNVDPKGGLGLEAAARHARYEALNTVSADFILLGHHQDDQAETFLLQLARGAGVKGLAGMAQIDYKRRLLRPLLNTKRTEIKAYAIEQALQWINDESNNDVKFDRNFMRHTLIPTFNQRYADISKTLARSAMHMGEASEMLEDLAKIDAINVLDNAVRFGAIKLDALFRLSAARQGNLIRAWLANNHINMPSAALLSQILEQLKSDKTDAAIKVNVSADLTVMRYQQKAYLVPAQQQAATINLLWQGEDMLVLPDQSRLYFRKQQGEGFAYKRGGTTIKLRIKNREGGEHFKSDIGRPRRRLKTIMQACVIPPWQREKLPLIFMDETLVIIPNIGVNAEMKAEDHEEGLTVTWEPFTSQE